MYTREDSDEPLTPTGRFLLQPHMNQVINAVIGVKNPIDIDAIRAEITRSIMDQRPRFYSILVIDSNGREHWRKTQFDVDRHLIIRHEPLTTEPFTSDEDAVNDYVADLSVSSPLSMDKPLWELHLLVPHKCGVFRVHHALGDGISLMSLFLSFCRKADDPTQVATAGVVAASSSYGLQPRRWSLWGLLKMLWYTLVYVVEAIMICLWMKDKKTAVSGGDGVELWPRKLATATFMLEDMKTVKRAVVGATNNDVLFGVISRGLSRYLDIRSAKAQAVKEGTQITGVAMVNIRPEPGLQEFPKLLYDKIGPRFGNHFGMIILPAYYRKSGADPLEFVRSAKAMIDKKKQSLEAFFSFKIMDVIISCFGPKFASLLNYRIVCNTSFTISNVIGPREEIRIVGNPVTFLRATSTSLAHAITMHMMSYGGRADMQILVAKDIIPDPKLLAKCFEDALLEMKAVAEAATR